MATRAQPSQRIRGPWPSLRPYPHEPVWTLLRDAALRRGEAPALLLEDGQVITYARLWREALATGAHLQWERGITRGSIVAVASTGDAAFIATIFGALLAGATVSPMNPSLGFEDAAHQLRLLQPALVIGPEPLLVLVQQLGREGTLPHCPVARFHELDSTPAKPVDPVPIDAVADLAFIPFSSGTSGFPKGIELTHADVHAATWQCLATDHLGPSSRVLNLRLFWTRLLAILAAGATCVTQRRHDPEQTLWLMRHRAVTHLLVRPSLLRALLKALGGAPADLETLQSVETGAEPLPEALAKEAARALGCPVRQAFHLMETAGSANRHPPSAPPSGGVGWPVPDTDERIVDPETLQDAPANATGELWIRGPQVSRGYWQDPEATARTMMTGGWLRTGDLARFDSQQGVVIVDRLKDVIKVRGLPVAPSEIEAVLLRHPAVRAAAVIRATGPDGGEVPLAYVVLDEQEVVSDIELQLLIGQSLAPHKQVHAFRFVPELPTTSTGKVQRRALDSDA